jgi:hypothetical protein
MSETQKDVIEYTICIVATFLYMLVQPNIVTGVLL